MVATLHGYLCSFMIVSRRIILRMGNVSNKCCRENQNARFMFSNFFFRKSWRLWDNVEKCGRVRDATDDSIIQRMLAHCMLEDYGYRKHSEYVILMDFQRQKVVTWTRLIVTFIVHWLFCTNLLHVCALTCPLIRMNVFGYLTFGSDCVASALPGSFLPSRLRAVVYWIGRWVTQNHVSCVLSAQTPKP